jgi:hypothetical protein
MFSPKERKGRKTSNNKQQHQNAVIVATGFVHFCVWWNEWVLPYGIPNAHLFWRVHFSRFTISSSCHSHLVVVSTLNWNKSTRGGRFLLCLFQGYNTWWASTLQLEEMTTCEFTEHPNLVWDHMSLLLLLG